MLADPQYVILFDHFARFLRRANAHGIDVAPLKGAHLLTAVYPAHEGRGRLADVDFLVRERDFERTFAVLEELGFARKFNASRPEIDRVAEDVGFHFEVAPGQRILFEVHRHLERKDRHAVDYDALWARAVPSMFDGVPCLRLSVEDHLLHAVMHLYSNRFHAPRRALRDLELLITRAGANLEIVQRRACEWECARATWLALQLLHESRPGLDVASTLDALRPSRPVAAALRWLVPDPEGLRFVDQGVRLEQAMLWPWLMDNPLRAVRFAASYGWHRVQDVRSRVRNEWSSSRR